MRDAGGGGQAKRFVFAGARTSRPKEKSPSPALPPRSLSFFSFFPESLAHAKLSLDMLPNVLFLVLNKPGWVR